VLKVRVVYMESEEENSYLLGRCQTKGFFIVKREREIDIANIRSVTRKKVNYVKK
jgi:hypothetical protein